MHTCCGPCSVYPLEKLSEEGHEVFGLFFNPNIHPYTEFKNRLDSAKLLYDMYGKKLIVIEEYSLEEFLRNCAFRENARCIYCYSVRLEKTASVAKKSGFDAFTTSLLVSPYQKHDLIKELGEAISKKYGIEFYYRDFREGFKEGRQKARQIGLYMQKYCGCIYSEKERFYKEKQDDKSTSAL